MLEERAQSWLNLEDQELKRFFSSHAVVEMEEMVDVVEMEDEVVWEVMVVMEQLDIMAIIHLQVLVAMEAEEETVDQEVLVDLVEKEEEEEMEAIVVLVVCVFYRLPLHSFSCWLKLTAWLENPVLVVMVVMAVKVERGALEVMEDLVDLEVEEGATVIQMEQHVITLVAHLDQVVFMEGVGSLGQMDRLEAVELMETQLTTEESFGL